MTSDVHIRRVSSPAYYLGRPAALWLTAFAPQSAGRKSCISESSAHTAIVGEALNEFLPAEGPG